MTIEPWRPDPAKDPPRALPSVGLAVGFGAVAILQVVAAFGLTGLNGWGAPTRMGIIVGGSISLLVAALALIVMRPWQPRPMADWSILWLGATTVRFLFTPLALFSVYFATPLPGAAVLLGGTAAYLAVLAVETVVIGRSVLHPDSRAGSKSSSATDSDRGTPGSS